MSTTAAILTVYFELLLKGQLTRNLIGSIGAVRSSIYHTYEYVIDVLLMRTIVQLYAYVTITYVYECHMSNLTRVQTIQNLYIFKNCKEKSMQLDCVDRTDQDLHCLPLILSHITLKCVKPDQML